jgi:hypothetical protein
MSTLVERQIVQAPLASAARLLAAYIAANPASGGTGARVVLHAADFNRPAIVTIAPAPRPGDMAPRYAVHWEAEGGGPYPVFDGSLTVEGDNDYDSFWLVVDGSYEPPAGLAGKLFDAVVGNRIASTATQNLLVTIRDSVQAVFESEERTKQQHRSKIETGA